MRSLPSDERDYERWAGLNEEPDRDDEIERQIDWDREHGEWRDRVEQSIAMSGKE